MNPNQNPSRRDFLKTSTLAMSGALVAPFVLVPQARSEINSDTLKVGLIGCGSRGSGAAKQALLADKNVVLVAMGDAFPDRLDRALKTFASDPEVHDKLHVDEDHRFVGLDAYQKVLASNVDVVILATPPGFRPIHLKAAVEAGKHIFCEKPMAVDAPGVRTVLEAAEQAKKKNLNLVAGFCWRYNLAERAAFQRVLDGAIGDVRAVYGTYNTAGLWSNPRKPDWGDLEWQMRNWLYFSWLSGDHIAEQAVHNIDKLNWAMNNVAPLRAVAHGGRQVRTDPAYGHIYDHFSVVYDYPNGAKGFLFCRQQDNCASDNSDVIWGTKGTCNILGFRGAPNIVGENQWRYKGERPDMYQIEHNELFASIRAGKAHNDGPWMAQSTMMAILGRMAGYTGQSITWEEAMASNETLMPAKLDWKAPLPVAPVAMPGRTRLV
jgi:myo-inositol 2-dehydrogenase/D-chiro-inositol 1-dehydrogenase